MADAVCGLLDTSVVIDHDEIDPALLPRNTAIAAITLAELVAGPLATLDPAERARRQDRLQWAVSVWEPLPFDAAAARAYGRVYAATRAASARGHGPVRPADPRAAHAAGGGAVVSRAPASAGRGNARSPDRN